MIEPLPRSPLFSSHEVQERAVFENGYKDPFSFDSLRFERPSSAVQRIWNKGLRLLHKLFRPLLPIIGKFFSLFIDVQGEKRAALYRAITQFKDRHFFEAEGDLDLRAETFQKEFSDLPSSLQLAVQNELTRILKNIFPTDSVKEVEKKKKQVFKTPYIEYEDKSKPKDKAMRLVMGEALVRVASKLALPNPIS